MKIEKLREMLSYQLWNSQMSRENATAIMLTLGKIREAMTEMIVYIYDNNPTNEEIMNKFFLLIQKYIKRAEE